MSIKISPHDLEGLPITLSAADSRKLPRRDGPHERHVVHAPVQLGVREVRRGSSASTKPTFAPTTPAASPWRRTSAIWPKCAIGQHVTVRSRALGPQRKADPLHALHDHRRDRRAGGDAGARRRPHRHARAPHGPPARRHRRSIRQAGGGAKQPSAGPRRSAA